MEEDIIFESVNTRAETICNPKIDRFNGKILFKEQFDRAQEILSNSTFSKEVLEKINKEYSK